MLTPPRLNTPELLDEHDAPRADMERSLRDLRRINRFLGGMRVYERMLREFPNVRSVVDLGAGTADLLESVPGDVLRVALDFKIDHMLYMRDGSRARRVVADARALPFRDRSVDVVTSSHFFHHFEPEENATIAREAMRVAKRGFAFTDTRRHYLALWFISLAGALRLIGRITRVDGPASVRRGYTVNEARDVARSAGAPNARIAKYFPFRFAMIVRK